MRHGDACANSIWEGRCRRAYSRGRCGNSAFEFPIRQQEEKARKRALRRAQCQGRGTPLPREDSACDPHAYIRQALAQHQAEAVPLDPPMADPVPAHTLDMAQGTEGLHPAPAHAQARDWRVRLEELKRMPV